MKKGLKISTIIMIVCCIIGLSALLYPTLSDYWNENYTTRAITEYAETVQAVSDEDYRQLWDEATKFNADLRKRTSGFVLPQDMEQRYHDCLDLAGDGLMGYIEIPKIDVQLPVYHTVEDTVLQRAIGHLPWSSLPTGGAGTHCVLSGHRGLPSARLLTDLDQLREGDTFLLNVLNETLTYEVDQIRTVEPTDVSNLGIEEGKDYCTLVTCTPYGINTHRLLVRGHRIENSLKTRVVSDAVIIDQLLVASFLAVPILLALVLVVMFKTPESKKRKALEEKLQNGGEEFEEDK